MTVGIPPEFVCPQGHRWRSDDHPRTGPTMRGCDVPSAAATPARRSTDRRAERAHRRSRRATARTRLRGGPRSPRSQGTRSSASWDAVGQAWSTRPVSCAGSSRRPGGDRIGAEWGLRRRWPSSTSTPVRRGCITRTSSPSFRPVVMTEPNSWPLSSWRERTSREYLGGRPPPVLTAAEVVETLARAVHEAHRLGFRHGDLTAARVLLAPSNPPRFVDPELGHLCEENGRELIPRITGFGMAGAAGAGRDPDSPVAADVFGPRVDPVRAAHRPAAAGCGVDRSGSRLAECAESEGAEGSRGDLPGLPRTRPRPPPRRRRAAGRRTPSVPRHVRHPVPVQPMLQGDQIQEAAPGWDDGRPLPPLRGAIARGTLGGEGPSPSAPERTERHEPAPAPPVPETRHDPAPSQYARAGPPLSIPACRPSTAPDPARRSRSRMGQHVRGARGAGGRAVHPGAVVDTPLDPLRHPGRGAADRQSATSS